MRRRNRLHRWRGICYQQTVRFLACPRHEYRRGTYGIGVRSRTEKERFLTAYLITSSFTRFASSSLYNSAARLLYFFLVSESASKADPPYFVKNSMAEALPPTFIVRSWLVCQLSRWVDLRTVKLSGSQFETAQQTHLTKLICTPRFLCTLEHSKQM